MTEDSLSLTARSQRRCGRAFCMRSHCPILPWTPAKSPGRGGRRAVSDYILRRVCCHHDYRIAHFMACSYSAFTNRLGFFEKGNNAFIGKELREIRIYGLDKALRFGLSFKALFFTGTGLALRLHREVVTHW